MQAGPIRLEGRVLLSPLCGVTDSPFRMLARKNGAAMVFCEMTSSDGLVRKNPKTFELLEYRPEERPIGAQLCGSDPASWPRRRACARGWDSIPSTSIKAVPFAR